MALQRLPGVWRSVYTTLQQIIRQRSTQCLSPFAPRRSPPKPSFLGRCGRSSSAHVSLTSPAETCFLPFRAMLRVIVVSASNIPKTKFGKPDPIVSVIFKDEKKKTKKIDNELNPVWNEILEFDLRSIPLDSSSSLRIVVKDFETVGQNKLIGTATVSLKDLIGDQSRSQPYKLISLLNEKGQDTGEKRRTMEVRKTGWTARSAALGPECQVGPCREVSLPRGSRKGRTAGGCCLTSHRTSRSVSE